jgi:hypothetical protein
MAGGKVAERKMKQELSACSSWERLSSRDVFSAKFRGWKAAPTT